MRVAAIDCGTNSIRMLIADMLQTASGTELKDVIRRTQVVRLGEGVDVTGRLGEAALRRTLDAARSYAARCRVHQVERVRFVATSATRDASNAADFGVGVQERFAANGFIGVRPEVVSGLEEAALSFAGATADLVASELSGPYLLVDLGGGSTEIVRGDAGGVQAACSLDMGCVRFTERYFRVDPPTREEVAAARVAVCSALAEVADRVPLTGVGALVGVAGSITTVTAHVLGLARYDSSAIHLSQVDPQRVGSACDQLLAMTRAQRLELGFMHPGRADVIGAGALIWREVVELVLRHSPQAALVASEHDILDGIARSIGQRAT